MDNNKQTEAPRASRPLAPTSRVRRSKKPFIISGIITIAVLGFLGGFAGSYVQSELVSRTGSGGDIFSSAQDGNAIISADEADVATVAERVAPSVVSIITSASSRGGLSYSSQAQSGAGTGVVISKDGYILTNNHVINGASRVSVVTSDGETYEDVQIVGRDPLNDIAFLKVTGASDLSVATLGDSKSVRIGQKVVAIGNALGQFQNTVTSGIISGVGRSVAASTDGTSRGEVESLSDLIQTDAAINSGNSGGPLVNMAGQVIGINTAVASDANSVGFVIPISSTKGMISGLLETGKVTRAYIGVRYLNITSEVARAQDLSVRQGAYIFSDDGKAIVSGGPADKAGLKSKDIITKVNGIEVGVKGSVATLIGEHKPDDTIELTVLREKETLTLKVTLAAYNN